MNTQKLYRPLREENPCLWIPAWMSVENRNQYLWGMEKKVEMLIEQLASDPGQVTSNDPARQMETVLPHLVQKVTQQAIGSEVEIRPRTPGLMARDVVDHLIDASEDETTLLSVALSRGTQYEQIPGKVEKMIEEETLSNLLLNLMTPA